jgi:hypothetical protein
MITKCDEENMVLFCDVTNWATGSKPARRNDVEEASEDTYVQIGGFVEIRLK